MNVLVICLLVGTLLNSLGLFYCIRGNKRGERRRMKLEKLERMEMNEMKNKAESEDVTVGEKVQAILKSQGIKYELDEDEDVCFEYHFTSFLLEQSKSTDYFCLTVGIRMGINEKEMMRFLQVANQLQISYKMVRMICFENGIKLSVETMVFPGMDLKHLLSYSLYLLEAAVEESSKLYKGSDEKESLPNSIIGFNEVQEQMLPDNKEDEAKEEEPAEKETSGCRAPSIGFNSSRYRV